MDNWIEIYDEELSKEYGLIDDYDENDKEENNNELS